MGTLGGALGSLASGLVGAVSSWLGTSAATVERGGFLLYAGVAVLVLPLYWGLTRPAPEAAGTLFFVTGAMGGISQLVSGKLAARSGLIETMVFTHLPANLFLILAGVMPNASLAVLFVLLRAALSQMDVPARQSYVMAVVPPEERTAASSLTNVPRSLAALEGVSVREARGGRVSARLVSFIARFGSRRRLFVF